MEEVGRELDLEHSRGLGLMEAIGEVAETRCLPNSELVEVVVMGGTVLENRVPLGVTVVDGGLVTEVCRNAGFGMKAMGSQRWSVSSRWRQHNQHMEPGLEGVHITLPGGEQSCLHLGALGSPFWGTSLSPTPSCNDFSVCPFPPCPKSAAGWGTLSRTCKYSPHPRTSCLLLCWGAGGESRGSRMHQLDFRAGGLEKYP